MIETHELKTWPAAFEPILRGTLTHQIRRKDRSFAVGDFLLLREWDPKREVNDRYTGRAVRVTVTHISSPGTFGLPEEICVMSIGEIYHLPNGPSSQWVRL